MCRGRIHRFRHQVASSREVRARYLTNGHELSIFRDIDELLDGKDVFGPPGRVTPLAVRREVVSWPLSGDGEGFHVD
jgi:hypothetical protein